MSVSFLSSTLTQSYLKSIINVLWYVIFHFSVLSRRPLFINQNSLLPVCVRGGGGVLMCFYNEGSNTCSNRENIICIFLFVRNWLVLELECWFYTLMLDKQEHTQCHLLFPSLKWKSCRQSYRLWSCFACSLELYTYAYLMLIKQNTCILYTHTTEKYKLPVHATSTQRNWSQLPVLNIWFSHENTVIQKQTNSHIWNSHKEFWNSNDEEHSKRKLKKVHINLHKEIKKKSISIFLCTCGVLVPLKFIYDTCIYMYIYWQPSMQEKIICFYKTEKLWYYRSYM